MKVLCYILLFFYTLSSLASIKKLNLNQLNQKNYSLNFNFGKWEQLMVASQTKLVLALESTDESTTFTLREFKKNKSQSLKTNVSTWISDYKSYGFKIKDNFPLKLNNETYGYFIEAFHKKTRKSFSQFISFKEKKFVTLTCQSSEKAKAFSDCKKVLKSFSWKKSL